jgi:hypothetical protein
MRVRLSLIGAMLLLIVLPPTANAATSGGVMPIEVDARGCIMPSAAAGRLVATRRHELAAAAIFGSEDASNSCMPRPHGWMSAPVWRSGWTMLARRPGELPLRRVEIEVRRLDIAAEDSWLVTRVGTRELRVQHEVDQCSPRAWFRVVETDTEVRLRYFRPKARGTSCTLVLFSQWAPERVLKLRAPLGTRRIVVELGHVRTDYIDETCTWVSQSLSALIAGASATELDRLVLLEPQWGFGSQELTWTGTIAAALKLDDVADRATIARGVRRDMRRLAYPESCTRQFKLPSATSTAATSFVVGGSFGDADLLGLDDAGQVTWSSRLDGAVIDVDACPDGAHAMFAERVPGNWWASSARLRVGFVDLRTGVVDSIHGIRPIAGDDPSNAYVSARCSSGAQRHGWLQTSYFDYELFRLGMFVDEVFDGTSRRVQLPAKTPPGLLGDGVLFSQTSEPTSDAYSDVVPGRLVRTDLRTGAQATGPLLPAQAHLMDLSEDGRTLVTGHGPIRTWDVSTGIRMLASFPDPTPGQSQRSGAWTEDGGFVLLDFPISDMDPRPNARGRFFRIDPGATTMTAMAGWPRDSNDQLGLADRGRLFTWQDFALDEESAGMRTFNPTTNRWDVFAPATAGGEVVVVDVVR